MARKAFVDYTAHLRGDLQIIRLLPLEEGEKRDRLLKAWGKADMLMTLKYIDSDEYAYWVTEIQKLMP